MPEMLTLAVQGVEFGRATNATKQLAKHHAARRAIAQLEHGHARAARR